MPVHSSSYSPLADGVGPFCNDGGDYVARGAGDRSLRIHALPQDCCLVLMRLWYRRGYRSFFGQTSRTSLRSIPSCSHRHDGLHNTISVFRPCRTLGRLLDGWALTPGSTGCRLGDQPARNKKWLHAGQHPQAADARWVSWAPVQGWADRSGCNALPNIVRACGCRGTGFRCKSPT